MNPGAMNPEALLDWLTGHEIPFSLLRHAPVFSVSESEGIEAQLPGGHSKNLFLNDGRGRIVLVSAWAHSVVPVNRLHPVLGSRRLSFGKPELLRECLGVEPGSVTPLALIADEARRVEFVLDRALLDYERVYFHPLRNDATIGLSPADFLRILVLLDREPLIVDFTTL